MFETPECNFCKSKAIDPLVCDAFGGRTLYTRNPKGEYSKTYLCRSCGKISNGIGKIL